jgi:hypothetical protein
MTSIKTQDNDFANHFLLVEDEICYEGRPPARSASKIDRGRLCLDIRRIKFGVGGYITVRPYYLYSLK